jgi:Reverse transcriptase (RNA-dependent DNA polymerase)
VPPPVNQNIVGYKRVYKIKRKADGSIKRFKAWLVAKDYNQEEHINYVETFSPVIRLTKIRLVLSLAVNKIWSLKQLDVQDAFLHVDLKETVYMHQPPSFVNPTAPDHMSLI